ncbi:MAG: hypothetical protein HZB31_07080 [Nitrospirae bacterium]|nr:hypothetical protein [Nitrospirota bacterium]
MSNSDREELLGLIQAFSPGAIYTIAPKQYVVRGFDYYRQDRLVEFAWTPDRPVLIATVKGTWTYHVTIRVQGKRLSFSCGCPAWSYHSNCKHVICSIITIANLLDPSAFKIVNRDESRRQGLLRELFGEPALSAVSVTKNGNHELPAPEVMEYSIVIHKDRQIIDIQIRLNGKRLTHYHSACPHELRQFVHPQPSYPYMSRMFAFEHYLNRYGNKHPFMLETENGETRIQFDEVKHYRTCTCFDAYPGQVTISKLCFYEDREIGAANIAGDYVFDLDAGTFSVIRDRSGWQLWNECNDIFHPYGSFAEEPEDVSR